MDLRAFGSLTPKPVPGLCMQCMLDDQRFAALTNLGDTGRFCAGLCVCVCVCVCVSACVCVCVYVCVCASLG